MKIIISKWVQSFSSGDSLIDEYPRNKLKDDMGKNPWYGFGRDGNDDPVHKNTIEVQRLSTPGRASPSGSSIQSVYPHRYEENNNNELSSDFSDGRRAREDTPLGTDSVQSDENINPYRGQEIFRSDNDHTYDNALFNYDNLDRKNREHQGLEYVRNLKPVSVSNKRYSVN